MSLCRFESGSRICGALKFIAKSLLQRFTEAAEHCRSPMTWYANRQSGEAQTFVNLWVRLPPTSLLKIISGKGSWKSVPHNFRGFFVYRQGHQLFKLKRWVRFPYRLLKTNRILCRRTGVHPALIRPESSVQFRSLQFQFENRSRRLV